MDTFSVIQMIAKGIQVTGLLQRRVPDRDTEREQNVRELIARLLPLPTRVHHNSFVGFLVVDWSTPEGKRLCQAAQKQVQSYIDVAEVETIQIDEFRQHFPNVQLYEIPSLVIWSTEKRKAFSVIPFENMRHGQRWQSRILPDEAEINPVPAANEQSFSFVTGRPVEMMREAEEPEPVTAEIAPSSEVEYP